MSGETLRIFGNMGGKSGVSNIDIQIYTPSGRLLNQYSCLSLGSFGYSVKLNINDPSGEYTRLSGILSN